MTVTFIAELGAPISFVAIQDAQGAHVPPVTPYNTLSNVLYIIITAKNFTFNLLKEKISIEKLIL